MQTMAPAQLTAQELAALRRAPEIQSLLEKNAKQIADDRKAAEVEIKRIEAQLAKEIPHAMSVLAKADAEVQRATDALNEAQRQRKAAWTDQWNMRHRADAAIIPHRQFLRDTCPPAIDHFLDRCQAEHTRMRRDDVRDRETEMRMTNGWLKETVIRDNSEQISARLKALCDAQEQALRLKDTKADFTADLDRLWNALPSERLDGKAAL
jgi:hypothetical protein